MHWVRFKINLTQRERNPNANSDHLLTTPTPKKNPILVSLLSWLHAGYLSLKTILQKLPLKRIFLILKYMCCFSCVYNHIVATYMHTRKPWYHTLFLQMVDVAENSHRNKTNLARKLSERALRYRFIMCNKPCKKQK